MRPKGLIGLLVVILIFSGIMFLLSDRFIESGLESAGTSIVGAKVEIDNLNFSLFGLSIVMDRLQVTNPNDTWKNLFETGRLGFDMRLTPLVRKKVIIQEITVADVRIGTRRATDGAIPESEKNEEPGWLSEATADIMGQVKSAPILQLGDLKKKVNVDSLIAAFDIQSVAKIEQTRADAQQNYEKWQTTVKNFKPQNDFSQIEIQVKELTSRDISGIDQLLTTVDDAKRIYDTLDKLKKDIETIKTDATQDFKLVGNTVGSVDNWIQDDLNAIKGKANLGEFTPQNVGKMLFGDALALPTIGILKYIAWIREYMPVAQQVMSAGKVEKPPRFEGQDIKFPLTYPLPDFLIESLVLSVAGNQQDTSRVIRVSGDADGITSDPKVYGKPLTFDLSAALPGSNAYAINGSLDHTGDVAEDRFRIQANGIHIGTINLVDKRYLPKQILADKGNITANFDFVGNQLDFKLSIIASPVAFKFADEQQGSNAIEKVIHNVFDSIEDLNVAASFIGLIGDFKLDISSNVDDILAKRLSDVMGESVKAARAELEQKFNALVEPKKQQALAQIGKYEQEIVGQIEKIEEEIDQQLQVLDEKKKEIEQKIAKEKAKGIDEVSDKLKGLFK